MVNTFDEKVKTDVAVELAESLVVEVAGVDAVDGGWVICFALVACSELVASVGSKSS